MRRHSLAAFAAHAAIAICGGLACGAAWTTPDVTAISGGAPPDPCEQRPDTAQTCPLGDHPRPQAPFFSDATGVPAGSPLGSGSERPPSGTGVDPARSGAGPGGSATPDISLPHVIRRISWRQLQ